MARSLVDTNILIYARDLSETEKRLRAIDVIDGLAARGELVLSVQCLNEFSAASLRRGGSPAISTNILHFPVRVPVV